MIHIVRLDNGICASAATPTPKGVPDYTADAMLAKRAYGGGVEEHIAGDDALALDRQFRAWQTFNIVVDVRVDTIKLDSVVVPCWRPPERTTIGAVHSTIRLAAETMLAGKKYKMLYTNPRVVEVKHEQQGQEVGSRRHRKEGQRKKHRGKSNRRPVPQ